MSAATENLIRAIQTNDGLAFYGWLQVLKGTPDLDASVTGNPGVTPLAVAAVMYSKAANANVHEARRYAAMVAGLMEAGANPLVRVGERFVVRRGNTGQLERRRVSEGQALAEVCGGVLAPAMRAWFAMNAGEDRLNTCLHRHHPAFVHSERHLSVAG